MRHCPFSILQIIANDTGNPMDCCSTATVTISLIDSNDHIPEFPQNTYNLSVMEGSPAGTVISPNITVRRWAGSGHSLRPPSRMLGTPGTTNAACVEGTGLSKEVVPAGTQTVGLCAHQGHIFGVLTASGQCPRLITALGAKAD